jgi:DNA-3-methyladenine glycosylase
MAPAAEIPAAGWKGLFQQPLPRSFYDRPTRTVARELLGKVLIHRIGREFRAVRLVEVEAYVHRDPASHAFRGPTERNRSMFLPPGSVYVFRIHQVCCANAVTRSGQAVLLRSGEPVSEGLGESRGPGRLCRALQILPSEDGSDLVKSNLRILPGPPPSAEIAIGPRVGIRAASDWPLRFSVRNNPFVSHPRPWARPTPQRDRSNASGAWPNRNGGGGPSGRSRRTNTLRAGDGKNGFHTGGNECD